MEQRSVRSFIFLGTAVRYVQDAEAGWSLKGPGHLLENVASLLEAFEENRLHVTERLASNVLVPVVEAILKRVEADEESGKDNATKLKKAEARMLGEAVTQVRDTLMAEAEGLQAFFTSDKRYEVNRLLGDVQSLMGAGVFGALPHISQLDFQEAGRCVAFELPTAAAFHLLRGTEAALRDYYCRIVKQNRVDPQTWGAMTDHLRRRSHLRPPDVLLDGLDHLRRGFRNPTQHPEKIYEVDEVQDLMGVCFDAASRMIAHLDEVDR